MTGGTKGVVLVVWGKRGYGFMAYNLAVSLKYHSPNVPITLIAHPQTMAQVPDKSVFDDIVWNEDFVADPGRLKAGMYKHLPYDYNLYLDVDALCFRPFDALFDELIDRGGNYYTFVNEVYDADSPNLLPQMYWAWKDDIWNKYDFSDTDKLPATQSSIQFIKKCAESEELFNLIENYFDDPIPLDRLRNQWGGSQPDELYLNIALAKLGIAPHVGDNVIWFGNNMNQRPRQLEHTHYFLSFFGYRDNIRSVFWDYYDQQLIKMCRSRGGNHVFKQKYIKGDKHANANRNVIKRPPDKPLARVIHRVPLKKTGTIHLFIAWFQVATEGLKPLENEIAIKRNKELQTVIERNISLDSIAVIYNLGTAYNHEKVVNISVENSRPTYEQFVEAVNNNPGDYNIIANTDIFFTREIEIIKTIDFHDTAVALSRYDVTGLSSKLFNYEHSQDTWIFKGRIKPVQNCGFVMGVPGCDNRFAYELAQAGYRVINPAFDVKTYHLHQINNRSYTEDNRIHGNYLPVKCDAVTPYLKRRLIIHQPGKVGDLVIILPIAKLYQAQGYEVEILCPVQYHTFQPYIDYAIFTDKKTGNYAKEIDLSFGILQNTRLHAWWIQNRKKFPSFVNAKYHLAGVDLKERHNLIYERNQTNENELFQTLGLSQGCSYILVHDSSDYGTPIHVDSEMKIVKFVPVGSYTIFDWRKVIEQATEIHCIDSSLANFVEVIETSGKKFFYRVKERNTESLFNLNKWQLVLPGQVLEKEAV